MSWRASRGSGFYDHEIAQAIVQALQQRCDAARQILDLGLVMAADRLKDENRVRYLSACFGVALMICAIGGLLCWMSPQVGAVGNAAQPYLLASVFGAIGAAFSIGVRVRSFEFAPCRYSPMNYVMGGLRVTMGVIAGGVLLLLVTAKLIPVFVDGLNDLVGSLSGQPSAWTKVAAIGFLAGFAERLVPNLMRGADQQMSHYQQVASVNAEQVAREEDKAMKPAS